MFKFCFKLISNVYQFFKEYSVRTFSPGQSHHMFWFIRRLQFMSYVIIVLCFSYSTDIILLKRFVMLFRQIKKTGQNYGPQESVHST